MRIANREMEAGDDVPQEADVYARFQCSYF